MTKNECDALLVFARGQLENAQNLIRFLESVATDSHAETRSSGEGAKEKRDIPPTPPIEKRESSSTKEEETPTRARGSKNPTFDEVREFAAKRYPAGVPDGWLFRWALRMTRLGWIGEDGAPIKSWRRYLVATIDDEMKKGFAEYCEAIANDMDTLNGTQRPTVAEIREYARLHKITDEETQQFLDDMAESEWSYVTNTGATVYVNRRNYAGIFAKWTRTNRRLAKIDAKVAERHAKLDAKAAERHAKLDAKAAEREAKLDAKAAERDAKMDAYRAERDAKIAAERQQQRLSSTHNNSADNVRHTEGELERCARHGF